MYKNTSIYYILVFTVFSSTKIKNANVNIVSVNYGEENPVLL